jgi:hypothetical protein
MVESNDTIPMPHINRNDLDGGPNAEAARNVTAPLTPRKRASIVPGPIWTPIRRKPTVNQSGLSPSVDDSASIAELKVKLVRLVTYNIDAPAHEKEDIEERRLSLISRISLAEALGQKKRDDSRRGI